MLFKHKLDPSITCVSLNKYSGCDLSVLQSISSTTDFFSTIILIAYTCNYWLYVLLYNITCFYVYMCVCIISVCYCSLCSDYTPYPLFDYISIVATATWQEGCPLHTCTCVFFPFPHLPLTCTRTLHDIYCSSEKLVYREQSRCQIATATLQV